MQILKRGNSNFKDLKWEWNWPFWIQRWLAWPKPGELEGKC